MHSTLQNNIFSQLFVGLNIVSLPSVDSTNSWLKHALSNSAPLPEGTVIMAEEQYAGRGQQGNRWTSEPGRNLTISILLMPAFLPVDKQFSLNQTVSLALYDTLSRYFDKRATIKWPNDCMVGDEKIGGILIENIIQGNRMKYSVIGIGLNVNQIEYPEPVKNVTSFKKILQRDYDLKRLLSEICAAIEVRYLQLKAGKADLLDMEYQSCLYKKGIDARFRTGDEIKRGKILGTDPLGLLEVDFNGDTCRFGLKEIEYLSD
ncbi:MAG TPA: biotin--[acetyl-CoA-carboxylase] ligase [Sphingobacteriaceae bacterium]